ncbi:MAG: hypothetical protein AAFX78_20235 [Cyanobacteria bacterium J06638_20]
MAAQDKDGKGLIDGVPQDYELDSLCSTDFKFSAYGSDTVPVDAFTEHKLNEQANMLFNV